MKHRRRSDGSPAIEPGTKLVVLHRQSICGVGEYLIYKLDLNRLLSTSTRRRRSSDFSLSRCSSRSKSMKKSIRTNRLLTLGRFGRHHRLSGRNRQPIFPKPVNCRLELPEHWGMGMAVLDSKIYLIGGEVCTAPRTTRISRDLCLIDASADSPGIVYSSTELNYRTYDPIVCTIGGKIYVMSDSFVLGKNTEYEFEFECFDPKSNSCTVIPCTPILDKLEQNVFARVFEVRSHAVVGSNLVISFNKAGGVFTFDTTQPDRGWRRIHLVLDASRSLDFLPFDPRFSFPIRDDLIFCSPRVRIGPPDAKLAKFLGTNLDIEDMDSYVCSFDNVDALSNPECEFVKVSICRVTGIESKWKNRMTATGKEAAIFVNSSRAIGDEMVLVAKEGDYYSSFDIFRIQRAEDNLYRASNISSALFRSRSPLCYIDLHRSFVIKDGNFTP